MVKLTTAQELERVLKNLGKKRKNNKDFANDANYWNGGECNWGANHNLKEDCERIVKSLKKIANFKDIKKELQKSTTKQEYDVKRDNYIRECNEIINGLQNSNPSSAIFGVCIIWENQVMDAELKDRMKNEAEKIKTLESQLQKESYQWVQEIKALKLERTKLEDKIKADKKKAADPNTSLEEKALLLQFIDNDTKKLKKNLERQKEIDKKFTYDPDKFVSDFLEKIDSKLKSKKPKDKRDEDKDNHDSSNEDDDNDAEEPSAQPKSKTPNQSRDWFQENKLFIFGGIGLLIIFYLYYQRETENINEYEY